MLLDMAAREAWQAYVALCRNVFLPPQFPAPAALNPHGIGDSARWSIIR